MNAYNFDCDCINIFSVPGKPGELSFIVTSLSSLNLSWTPPKRPNGVIELYKIQYSQTGLSGKSKIFLYKHTILS